MQSYLILKSRPWVCIATAFYHFLFTVHQYSLLSVTSLCQQKMSSFYDTWALKSITGVSTALSSFSKTGSPTGERGFKCAEHALRDLYHHIPIQMLYREAHWGTEGLSGAWFASSSIKLSWESYYTSQAHYDCQRIGQNISPSISNLWKN